MHQFIREYNQILKKRLQEGGRGFFICEKGEENKIIGIANAYIQDNTLNIAEFYITPEERRKGIGSRFLDYIKAWGIQQNATQLVIAVDKNLELANRYWSSFNFALDASDTRNMYTTKLTYDENT